MRAGMVAAGILVVCLLGVTQVEADFNGRLFGRVTDEEGRPMAGARIVVRGEGAAGVYATATDGDGGYALFGLPARQPLIVSAETAGRRTITYSGLVVPPGFGTRRDFRLRPLGMYTALVLFGPACDYDHIVIEGIRSAFEGEIRVLELSGQRVRDGRQVLRALDEEVPSVLFAVGRDAARIARSRIKQVPVIFSMVPDPIADDLFARNLFGVALNGAYVDSARRLIEIRPDARRVATLYDPRRLAPSIEALRAALAGAGLSLVTRTVRGSGGIERALRELGEERPDAFFLLADPDLLGPETLGDIERFVQARDLVYVVPDPLFFDRGLAFSASPGFRDLGSEAGRLALEVLTSGVGAEQLALRFPQGRPYVQSASLAARSHLAQDSP